MTETILQQIRRLPPEIRGKLQADLEAGRLNDLLDAIATGAAIPVTVPDLSDRS